MLHVYSDTASEGHLNRCAPVERPERFPAALAGIEEAGRAGVPVAWRACRPAPEDAVRAVHSPSYLKCLEGASGAASGYLSADTDLGPGSWEATSLASGAAMGAVESALSGTAAFAVSRPPGHHAGRGYGMGFCLLNHAAVAAGHARSLGLRRVAILDWDVHHGNGTQDVFYRDEGVLYLSAHQSPLYPGTGGTREVGDGPGRGFTVNAPLPAGSGEEAYVAAFSGLFLPVLREFRPELLIVSAGYDAHAADPLGGMRLVTGSFGRFAAELAALTRELGTSPPALVLEGGYDLEALSASVAATAEGLGQEPPRWSYHGDVKPVEVARETLAPFWKSLR
ncbi:MAG: histone deacetylase [Rubrobacter sp.]|nr:histone deacetylase [Rubrobacter sp.]